MEYTYRFGCLGRRVRGPVLKTHSRFESRHLVPWHSMSKHPPPTKEEQKRGGWGHAAAQLQQEHQPLTDAQLTARLAFDLGGPTCLAGVGDTRARHHRWRRRLSRGLLFLHREAAMMARLGT